MKPHLIRYIGLHLTPEVGENDALLGVRVVPAGRDGPRVFGRTLGEHETDGGEAVAFYPYAGEELHFSSGSIHVHLRDIDRGNEPGPDGYAPIANTLWTWLTVGVPTDPAFFRFLFAAARRLDTAHSLCRDVLLALTDKQEPFIKARARLFLAMGSAELMCVALGRAVDMLRSIPENFSVTVELPSGTLALLPALRQIRNAFEHIEDRAFGNVRGTPHPDALSIFDQRDLIARGVLRYGPHSLDLQNEVLPILVACRRLVIEAAARIAGTTKTVIPPIIFPAAPARSYERIQLRAYFLWADRVGSKWWDAEANWLEAERADAAEYPSAG